MEAVVAAGWAAREGLLEEVEFCRSTPVNEGSLEESPGFTVDTGAEMALEDGGMEEGGLAGAGAATAGAAEAGCVPVSLGGCTG